MVNDWEVMSADIGSYHYVNKKTGEMIPLSAGTPNQKIKKKMKRIIKARKKIDFF